MVLARVALTTGDYTTAANAAGAVISAGYSLMNEEQYTTSGFQSTSLPETIWGYTWAASTSLGNRSFASFMSITAVDNANNKGIYMAIDDQLYNQIGYRLPLEEFQCDRDHGRGVHLSGLFERQVQHPDLRG